MLLKIMIEKKALKQLQQLDDKTRIRVIEALKILENEGFSRRLDIRKLRGYPNHYRLRVGGYRILLELTDNEVKSMQSYLGDMPTSSFVTYIGAPTLYALLILGNLFSIALDRIYVKHNFFYSILKPFFIS